MPVQLKNTLNSSTGNIIDVYDCLIDEEFRHYLNGKD